MLPTTHPPESVSHTLSTIAHSAEFRPKTSFWLSGNRRMPRPHGRHTSWNPPSRRRLCRRFRKADNRKSSPVWTRQDMWTVFPPEGMPSPDRPQTGCIRSWYRILFRPAIVLRNFYSTWYQKIGKVLSVSIYFALKSSSLMVSIIMPWINIMIHQNEQEQNVMTIVRIPAVVFPR